MLSRQASQVGDCSVGRTSGARRQSSTRTSFRLYAQAVLWLPPRQRAVFLGLSRTRAGAHSHHKVCSWRCAHILDSMFVIGVHEPHGARPEKIARTADRKFDRTFSNQPHFGVHMAVCRVAASFHVPPTTRRWRACLSERRGSAHSSAFESAALRTDTLPTACIPPERTCPRAALLPEAKIPDAKR